MKLMAFLTNKPEYELTAKEASKVQTLAQECVDAILQHVPEKPSYQFVSKDPSFQLLLSQLQRFKLKHTDVVQLISRLEAFQQFLMTIQDTPVVEQRSGDNDYQVDNDEIKKIFNKVHSCIDNATKILAPFSIIPAQLPAYAGVLKYLNNSDLEAMRLVSKQWSDGLQGALNHIKDDNPEQEKNLRAPIRDYQGQPQILQKLTGHTKEVNCIIALSYNVFVSGSSDGTMKVWNTNRGECLKTIDNTEEGWNAGFTSYSQFNKTVSRLVKLSETGFVSIGDDNKFIKIWDIDNETALQGKLQVNSTEPKKMPLDYATSISRYNNAVILTGHVSGSIHAWDLLKKEHIKTIKDRSLGYFEYKITALTTLPENCFASGSMDGNIEIWDYDKGNLLQTMPKTIHANGEVLHLSPRTNAGLLIGQDADHDQTIFWDTKNNTTIESGESHNNQIIASVALPDDSLLYATWDNHVFLLNNGNKNIDANNNPYALKRLFTYRHREVGGEPNPYHNVKTVNVLPGFRFASSSDNGSIYLWSYPRKLTRKTAPKNSASAKLSVSINKLFQSNSEAVSSTSHQARLPSRQANH